jgi:hypothetical protein
VNIAGSALINGASKVMASGVGNTQDMSYLHPLHGVGSRHDHQYRLPDLLGEQPAHRRAKDRDPAAPSQLLNEDRVSRWRMRRARSVKMTAQGNTRAIDATMSSPVPRNPSRKAS